MRRFVKGFASLIAASPFILTGKNYLEEAEPTEDLTPEIQTHINKIFLTSDVCDHTDLKIFAFDAAILGKQVATHLDTSLGRHITTRFNDGEISIQVLDAVRGHKVYIIKSFESTDINEGIMELILAVSCMKKSGAESITAIIPFFPYSTATSPFSFEQRNEGQDFDISFASDIVKMLENVGCDQIITLNSPMASPKGYAHKSTFISIEAPQIAVPYLIRTEIKDPILVGTQANRSYLRNIQRLGKSFQLFGFDCELGFFNSMTYIGASVKDRDIILYNNIIRTGNSMKKRVKALKEMGANKIYCFGFHGLCSNDLFEELINSLPIEQLIMTNTISHQNQNKKIRTISVSKLLAEIIAIIHDEKSLNEYRTEREMLKYAYLQKIKSLNQKQFSSSQIMQEL